MDFVFANNGVHIYVALELAVRFLRACCCGASAVGETHNSGLR